MKYKVIVFDLDDTLIDTTNELIPLACQRIHTYLASIGYSESFENFEHLRRNFVKTKSHKEFFKSLAPQFSHAGEVTEVLAALNRYFYEPEMPASLQLMAGAEDNLKYLNGKYQVFVVTAGVLKAQQRKLELLKISRFVELDHVLIVAEGAFATKKLAFENILTRSNVHPEEMLSVGNRLSQEIRMAKQLNARTCFFKHGEHADDPPQDQFEIPDYTIHSHKELISACLL